MTNDDFFAQLREVALTKQFMLTSDKMIRCLDDSDIECPITAVYNNAKNKEEKISVAGFHRAARELGLNEKQCAEIFHAADDDVFCQEHVRRELLQACGLEERR